MDIDIEPEDTLKGEKEIEDERLSKIGYKIARGGDGRWSAVRTKK